MALNHMVFMQKRVNGSKFGIHSISTHLSELVLVNQVWIPVQNNIDYCTTMLKMKWGELSIFY